MNEEFLFYIWKFQLFNKLELKTATKDKIEVIRPGILNSDSGPDFFNGQIKIKETTWVGNIEIHVKASDWLLHKHEKDEAYDKVILHVVWKNDRAINRKSGESIPCIELSGLVQKHLLDNYDSLQLKCNQIPCEKNIQAVDPFVIDSFLERILIERLESKSGSFERMFNLNKNDWESTFYQLLAKYFGFKVNAVPFELLASSLPFSIIRKHANKKIELEALLFGQAGFLEDEFNGSYPTQLQKEYKFLKHKYQLKAIDKSLWKFMRMRPSNFPTIRIAQFASLLHQNLSLFQQIIESTNLETIRSAFEVSASEYWNSHYQLDVPAAKNVTKNLGEKSIDILLVNTIIPMLFCYGKRRGDEEVAEKLFQFLQEIKSEQNKVVKAWKELGVSSKSAMQSQALLQLKGNYCDLKKCLTCSIGNSIIKKNKDDQ